MRSVGSDDLLTFSRLRFVFLRCVLSLLAVVFAVTPIYAADADRISSLRLTLSALNSARQTALHELEHLSLPIGEAADYRDFVVYLNTRIFNDCRELAKLGGEVALEGMQCPADAALVGTPAEQVQPTGNVFYTTGSISTEAMTRSEKSAELEGDFLSSLGDFDEMLLKEEDKIASRVPSQRESSSRQGDSLAGGGAAAGEAGESGETGEAGADSEAGGDRGEQSGESADASATDQQGRGTDVSAGSPGSVGSGSADVDHSVYGAPGGKLPPPEDDDIVARQLREAAEKEPDPELKKKLWEEYWKYKGVNKQGERLK